MWSSDFVILTGSKSHENYTIFATSRNTKYTMVSLSVSLERTAPNKIVSPRISVFRQLASFHSARHKPSGRWQVYLFFFMMSNDNSDRNSNHSTSESSSESDSDVQNVADPPLHAGRALTRTFIHLPNRIQTVFRKTAFKKLVDTGRVKDVGFGRRESAATITDSLVAAFPTLAGLDLSWWVIALNWKSNNHCYTSGLDCSSHG